MGLRFLLFFLTWGFTFFWVLSPPSINYNNFWPQNSNSRPRKALWRCREEMCQEDAVEGVSYSRRMTSAHARGIGFQNTAQSDHEDLPTFYCPLLTALKAEHNEVRSEGPGQPTYLPRLIHGQPQNWRPRIPYVCKGETEGARARCGRITYTQSFFWNEWEKRSKYKKKN